MPAKIHIVKVMAFLVVIHRCELDHKKGWALKNWCFQIVVPEKTLESPLDCNEMKLINPKGNQRWISFEGLMLNLQYFGHLMQRADSLKKTLMLGKIERRRSRPQRMWYLDSITNWMDVSLGKLQEILRHRRAWHAAVHGIKRVEHVLVTEQQEVYCLLQGFSVSHVTSSFSAM